ncbi:hypothetical protein DVB69_10475 [Sporosarcina sp. BI001-red]|uniref:hypothetical protein n=1 Tax=Sporosarcina sp. BI001-red TaxID=2282866 RepID=UPI000E25D4B7|nr:hypothetical protein [Sporosarcina sp. BI001-red]REB07264.1 hypothetical protein DVB69_10475 [Sporosarcina sp. BI001-red]
MMRGRLTTKNFGLVTATILVCMISVGCTQGSATEKIETVSAPKTETAAVSNTEKEIKIIEAVLQEELNGPDELYIQLSEAAMGGTELDSVKQKENEMKLESYMKEKFLPYYTEEGLKRARGTNMLYQYQSQFEPDSESAIKLIDSEVKQSEIDTASNQYHVKATVEYTSPDEEPSLHELEGKVIFSTKEGKIGVIQFGQMDSSLSKKIRNWSEE